MATYNIATTGGQKFPVGTVVKLFTTSRPGSMPETGQPPTSYSWLTDTGLTATVDAAGGIAFTGLTELTDYVLAQQVAGVWRYVLLGRHNLTAAATGGGVSRVLLPADVANSTVTLADVTGLAFPMVAGGIYAFKFVIDFTADLATTGSRWGVEGPAAVTRAETMVRWAAAANTVQFWVQDGANNSVNVNPSPNSVAGQGNLAIMEGIIKNGANAGNLTARFASEVAGGIITAKAPLSYVEYQQIG